jgi:anti-sigma factor RsiW
MKTACPRLFEAEARRDGRLSGAEVARFEAHLGVCPICAQEVHALEALAAALRSPVAACDELHVRRERTRFARRVRRNVVPSRRTAHPALGSRRCGRGGPCRWSRSPWCCGHNTQRQTSPHRSPLSGFEPTLLQSGRGERELDAKR